MDPKTGLGQKYEIHMEDSMNNTFKYLIFRECVIRIHCSYFRNIYTLVFVILWGPGPGPAKMAAGLALAPGPIALPAAILGSGPGPGLKV